LLTTLSIKNYALIDNLHVDFKTGLTIITGETGAGKSILLGGLFLILGKRADLSNAKDASKKCIVEAVFDIANYNLNSFFKTIDLDYESETIIRREILPSGKSRAFVNDTPVNLNTLTLLGEHLIDIHSQHQTLELTKDNFQFQIIDALAQNESYLSEYKTTLKNYKICKTELNELQVLKSEAIKEHDYNLFLLKELNETQLDSSNINDLEVEYETLNNVEEIKAELQLSNQLLSEEQIGIVNTLTQLKNSFQKLSSISENYKELFERINSVLIETDDITSEIDNAQDNLDANPRRLEEVSNKLQIIQNLFQKHSVLTIEELIDIQTNLSEKVSITENVDSAIEEKQNILQAFEDRLNTIAKTIHLQREKIIPELILELQSILSDLGMVNARFDIVVQLKNEFLSQGKDSLSFLFSANKGAEFKPLKKAVSGGELSRIMLSIKYVLSKYIQLPTIMFDEIDTGVSGEISNKMAVIMQEMSKSMQVFTITHLPQIAAKGDTHFKVFKADVEDKTITDLVKLNSEERIVEIAQMLGGKEMSTSAIAHAKQLLN